MRDFATPRNGALTDAVLGGWVGMDESDGVLLILRLSKEMSGIVAPLIWFDGLTMSGVSSVYFAAGRNNHHFLGDCA